MLWRQPYEPRVLRDVSLPPLTLRTLEDESHPLPPSCIVAGGFSVQAVLEVAVWTKLLSGAFSNWYRIILDPASRQDLLEVLPTSEQPRTLVGDGSPWRDLVPTDRSDRSFAAVIDEGRAVVLVVGPPTEEVWEEFEALGVKVLGT